MLIMLTKREHKSLNSKHKMKELEVKWRELIMELQKSQKKTKIKKVLKTTKIDEY